ncbi:peptidase S8/S53 domain-containing protein [Chytridium lagenaria]|nr:peptidase S8/S53 domain-containing protein [Chytridium lagenaria]
MHLIGIVATAVTAFILPVTASIGSPQSGAKIPNQYIVVYKPNTPVSTINTHEAWLQAASTGASVPELQRRGLNVTAFPNIPTFGGFGFLQRYQAANVNFKGYAAKISGAIADKLKLLPEVLFVEQDAVVTTAGVQDSPPSWGLPRLSKGSLPLPTAYTFPDSAGAGVDVYIIDTGIQIAHPAFGGRAVWDFAFDGQNTDGNGHGTHCSGTVGSGLYGVAKSANLHAVKVLDAGGSGTIAGVVAGVNYVASKGSPGYTKVTGVANMSLGGGVSVALDSAVQAAIANGIAFAIAAGNSNADACNASPARVPEAVTVGASTITDGLASFSNYGKCVDIIAPGVDITSTWPTNSVNTISGTSMAAPHVAGVMALLLGIQSYATVPDLIAATLASPLPICVTGPALTCDDPCVQLIIKADPYCGTTFWDSICVGEVLSICGITC